MFREMLRKKQQLSQRECVDILKTQLRGVLSVLGDDGWPYGVPLDHWYCEEDGCLYFHGGKTGHKVDAMRRHEKVSFCVCDEGVPDEEVPWALVINSVVVFGRAEMLEDHDRTMEVSRQLSYKFTDDEGYIQREIQRSGPGTLCFRLIPEHMTGKRVVEK